VLVLHWSAVDDDNVPVRIDAIVISTMSSAHEDVMLVKTDIINILIPREGQMKNMLTF